MDGHLLEGKTAFITGGAQGIGLAVAEAYLRQGAKVIAADVAPHSLESAQTHLDGIASGRAKTVLLDVTDQEATERCADTCFAEGGVDIIVPNAGILVLKHAIDTDLASWRRVIDVNLTGAFITATSFARRMVERKKAGRIIFTASLFGVRGGRENGAYSASKFGMVGLMQSMAAELADKGILVNAVCPGQIDTKMIQQLFQDRAKLRNASPASLRAELESKIPIGKLGPLDELAGAYVYLASDFSRYVVGQSLVVDGGWQVG
ncbi:MULTISPECIES: SDR family NAD(P)-dependent oxidoreductase [Mesorhizobium]|uniref:SDR family oxidoreductase n=1 Tax=Mesorhizobium denitrificans TaxID=2294114 RepID=A0A371X8W5_9HYPH|nr:MULTISPECIES: SDR family NAD(P)-dependent oxidoreductase [Mesorhizobium]RFC65668.1 SDR family oxidoreductase [Mesorhizobium denitrificans]